jgi:hypothetical protein
VEDWEDPARAWIDLVEAYRMKSIGRASALLGLAKKSKWTHPIFDAVLEEGGLGGGEEEEEEDEEAARLLKNMGKDDPNWGDSDVDIDE